MNRKTMFFSLIPVAVLSIILIVGVIFGAVIIAKQNRQAQIEKELEEIQDAAVEKLARNKGMYDEQSIVLSNVSEYEAKTLAERLGASLRVTANGKFATLTLPEGITIADVYGDDQNRKYLENMSVDYHVKTTAVTDEDGNEVHNTSVPTYTVTDGYYNLQDYINYLNVGDTWQTYRGNSIVVAVIDTGIDYQHPEFTGRISEKSYNATQDKIVKDYVLEGDEYDWSLIDDTQGHGTAVAGVIAAAMNGEGVVGIAPEVKLLVIKAECNANGEFLRSSDLVFGLYYAIEAGANVVNMSFGGEENLYADALCLAVDSDVLCVAAAGNNATAALTYPAADPNCIGVGALAENSWELAAYSNYGENVNLVAPGSTYTTLKGGKYGTMKGTSLASPIVAGTLALLKQQKKTIEFEEAQELLYASTYDLGSLGEDYYFGYGALDVYALLKEERGTVVFNYLTDEIDETKQVFIRNHTLQNLPEPERNYSVFEGWYYDIYCTEEVEWYADIWSSDLTLYANWINEDDGVPFTYVTLNDGTVEIRSYTGHRRYITIPEIIDEKTVSSIGAFAFDGQSKLRQVKLPDGLKNIGQGAFRNCNNLLDIVITDNVTNIGNGAFESAIRLSQIFIGKDSSLETIGDFAFKNSGITNFYVSDSVSYLNGSAFYGANRLQFIDVSKANTNFVSIDGVLTNYTANSIVAYPASHGITYSVPDSITEIGAYAFAFSKNVAIDLANVKSIGGYAFAHSALENIEFTSEIATIGVYAFTDSYYLANVTFASDNKIRTINEGVFSNCYKLSEIEIPANVITIENEAFGYDTSLRKLTFSEGSSLVSIGDNAFCQTSLVNVKIPASVLMIGEAAFMGCNYLDSLIFEEGSGLRQIAAKAFSKTSALEEINFPEALTLIDEKAFDGSGLTGDVFIPSNVVIIEAGAFENCHYLTGIQVDEQNVSYCSVDGVLYNKDKTEIIAYPAGNPRISYSVENTVKKIGNRAFCGSWNLKTVVFPNQLETLGEYAMCDCINITGYGLPSTLTYIQQYAFSNNKSLGSIYIPDNVIQISNYAFSGNMSMTSVGFGTDSKLPRISFAAFANTGIRTFTVPKNVSSIAQYAFSGCTNLRDIYFAQNSKLTSISAYLFDGCDNLATISFGAGSKLTTLQAHAFEGLRALNTVAFGDAKLEAIGNFAFRYCNSLRTITIPQTVTSIGRFAFYGNKYMSEIQIPASVEHIGRLAFYGTNNINVYFAADELPESLQENWDEGVGGYYLGVLSVQTDGDWKYASLSNGGVAILEYLGEDTEIDLTALDLDGDITQIGGFAFYQKNVETVILPDTVTSILSNAFAYSKLKSVTIPANVTTIGKNAFFYATDLESVTFAENSSLKRIEKGAFAHTSALGTITLPQSLAEMGSGVFEKSGIQTVVFENGTSMTEIPQNSFIGSKLVSVVIPNNIRVIDNNAFRDCLSLSAVVFECEEVRIMSNVFYNTGISTLEIGANVKYIGEYAFVGLTNLKNFAVSSENEHYKAVDGVLYSKDGKKLIAMPAGRTGNFTVPNSVETIGFGAFENSALSSVSFEDGINLLTLGYRAFYNAQNLTQITIPESVISIDYYAFAMCKNLTTVTFAGDNLKGIYEGAFYGDIKLSNITLSDGVVEISDYAFYGCSALKRIPVSETTGLKGVYDYSFAYTGITEFSIPESVIDIGAYAFRGIKIKDLTISDANKEELTIGIGAFQNCDEIEVLDLPFVGSCYLDDDYCWFGYIFGAGSVKANNTYVPNSLKKVSLGSSASKGWRYIFGEDNLLYFSNLEQIKLPYGLTNIEGRGFENCSLLTSIYIPESVTYIGGTFTGCDSLSAIYITDITGWCGITFGSSPLSYAHNLYLNGELVTDLVIPEGVKGIRHYAFAGCTSLTSIEIPDSVTIIEEYAFNGCSSLTSINIPDRVNSIGNYAFYGCNSLLSIEIPDSVTSIGKYVLCGCSSLSGIEIPNSVTRIEEYAFKGCAGFTSVAVPDSVTSIGKGAFEGCSNLTSITIPFVGNTKDGTSNAIFGYIFGATHYSQMTSTYSYMPSSLKSVIITGGTSIGDYAFYGCSFLTSIEIPDSVTSIGNCAFYSCGLKNLKISNNLTTIGDEAFRCSITSIELPNSVSSIGYRAFDGCNSLASITIAEDNPNYCSIGGILYNKPTTEIVAVPKAIKGNVIIQDGVTSIGNYAFYQCRSLISIEIPNSVTSIGYSAFSFCGFLTDVTFAEGSQLTIIESHAFSECSSLTSIEIPDSVTSIEQYAFHRCGSLKSVYITDVAKWCGISFANTASNPLNGAQKLYINGKLVTKLIIPEGITSIGNYAFYGCRALTSVTIPNSMTSIEECAFAGCDSLKIIIDHSDLNLSFGSTDNGYVAYYAYVFIDKENNTICKSGAGFEYFVTDAEFLFYKNCYNNTYRLRAYLGDSETVTLPLTIDGHFYSIYYMGGVQKVIVPEGFTNIESYAFYDCSSLESIEIPKSVTSIGTNAFYGCSSLSRVINHSNLNLTIGSNDYGYVACYATTLIDNNGNATYKDAGEGITDSGFKFLKDNGSYTVIAYLGDEETVTLPLTIEGHSYSINHLTGVQNVIIPEGFTSIEKEAFYDCSSLKSVKIPSSVKSIENYAFYNCSSLTDVEFAENSQLTIMGTHVFYGCSSLTNIELPNGVTSIGGSAFYGCSSLTSIEMPDSVTSIGYNAFNNCNSLTDVYITDIAKWCGISFEAVANPVSGAANLYFNGELVTDLVIPEGVKSIGNYAFSGLTSLKSIDIPDSVTSIGNYAFSGCGSLTSIEIPASVKSIGSSAFNECSSLAGVYITDVAKWCEISFSDRYSNPLYCAHNLYLNGELVTDLLISEEVTSIKYAVFYGCSSLTSIKIPNSVTSIVGYAFYQCSSLTSIEIPDSVTSIGNNAFGYCTSLKSIEIPDSVTSIEPSTFYGCSSLTSVEIPGIVTSIGDSAFAYCSSLTSIEIPKEVTSIKYAVFYGCSSLTSIELSNSVTSIGSSAFSGCSSLTSIEIPNSVTSIGNYAFDSCNSLESITLADNNLNYCLIDGILYNKSATEIIAVPQALKGNVTIPNSITSIVRGTFYNCRFLTSVKLPSGITSIGEKTFYMCRSLTGITIPASVTSIDTWAFYGCSSLEKVVFEEGSRLTSIGTYAFQGCGKLKSIIIPENVTGIGYEAFFGCNSLREVVNKSNLNVCIGDYGTFAQYAYILTDKSGNMILPSGNSQYNNYFLTDDGFMFRRRLINGQCYELVYYHGDEETVTLPLTVNGETYSIASLRGVQNVIIPEGFKAISSRAFLDCSSLKSVTIPESVTMIGDHAFNGCTGLTEITIPENVVSIGQYAFTGCSSLTKINIPEGVTVIDDCAFNGCSSLRSIILPESVTKIGGYAFSGCTLLESINIPENVESIGNNAFDGTAIYNCAVWENGALYYNDILLKVDPSVEHLKVKDSVKHMLSDAFTGCYSLRYLDINFINDTNDNSSYYFKDLTNLETLILGELPRKSNLYYQFGQNESSVPVTLKNVVLKKGCHVPSNQTFNYISGIRIFVEEEDFVVDYDRLIKNWNNGNKVYYGGKWIEAVFMSADGSILSDDIYGISQVIRQPFVKDVINGENTEKFIGWDIDGDGIADPIPATSVTNLTARAIVETIKTEIEVRFINDNGDVISSAIYDYGDEIVLPDEPYRKGYEFTGWRGYIENMAATASVDFFAEWKHTGDEHHYVLTVVAPDCENEGCDLYTCSECDHSYRENVVPALGHSFGEWINQTAATCMIDGAEYRICSVCGKREDATVKAQGHNYIVTVTKAATCKNEGKETYICSVCGEKVVVTTPKSEHNYVKVKANKTFLQWLIDHLLNVFFGYEGNESYYYKCDYCGHIMTSNETFGTRAASIMDVHEHTLGEWVIAKEPTSEEEGIYGRYCTDCGELIEADVLPKTMSYGDVNGDGTVDGKDLIVLRRYLVGAEVEIHTGADVNGDGAVDGKDVIVLRKYLVGTAQLGPTE